MKRKVLVLLSFGLLLSGCNETSIENSTFISSDESDEIIEDFESMQESNIPSQSDTDKESESTSTDNQKFYYFDEDISIYINPSVQYANLYTDSLGNEGQHMNDISKILVSMLDTYTNLQVYSNNAMPGLSLSKSVLESNNVKADYHLALHSNAGGGKGSEIFYTKSSYNFSKSVLESLNKILPYKTRGLKDGSKSLYELKNTTASACLLEILFHDDINQAKFIIDNKDKIAKSIYEGIVLYFLEK